jgi:WD40 repeat protein
MENSSLSDKTQTGFQIGDVTGDVSLQAGGDIVAGNKTVIQNIIQQTVKPFTSSPYKFLASYDLSDRDIFYGRSALIDELVTKVPRHKTIIINGASGAGKSSLVNAGLIPRLADNGYTYVSFRDYSEPLQQLREYLVKHYEIVETASASLLQLIEHFRTQESHFVLVFDQFERFFLNVLPIERRAFIEAFKVCMAQTTAQEMNFIFTLRQEFFGQMLAEFETVLPTFLNESTRLNLQPLSHEEAREAIIKPLENLEVKMGYDEQFVDEVLLSALVAQTREHQGINPPHLQIVCHQLYEAAYQRLKFQSMVVIDAMLYEELGGAQAILQTYLDKTVEEIALTPEKTAMVHALLKAMIQTAGTRQFVSLSDLQRALPDCLKTELIDLIDKLKERRVIEVREATYSLSHEFMVEKVRSWFDEREMVRQQAKETLERGLAEWKTSGALFNEKQVNTIRQALPDFTESEESLLLKSEAALQKQKRVRQALFGTVGASIILAIIVSVSFGILSRLSAQKAEEERNLALKNQSLFLAAMSHQETQKGNATNGTLLALEALPKSIADPDRPFVEEAQVALYSAVANLRERVVLMGHDKPISQANLSPDGLLIVTASDDKTARLWEAKTGNEVVQLVGHDDEVWDAQFSPNGDSLVTASKDKTARLWQVSGKAIAILNGHEEAVYHAQFSPDGALVVTASKDKTARLWEAKTGQPLAVLKGHEHAVRYATFSPDGRFVLTTSYDKTARLWAVETLQPVFAPLKHDRAIWYGAFSADGQYIVTVSTDKTAAVWQTKTGEQVSRFRGHEGFVNQAVFSPDGLRLLTASSDKTARLWEVGTGKALAKLSGHEAEVSLALFSPDGERIVTVSADKTARLWADTGKPLFRLSGHEKRVTDVTFSLDGKSVLTASADQTARLWRLDLNEPVAWFSGEKKSMTGAAFSPNGEQILTRSKDKSARLWNVVTGKMLIELTGHADEVTDAVFSPIEPLIATASKDKTVRLWSVDTGKSVAVLKGHYSFVYSVEWHPDGRYIVSASRDKTARIWAVEGGQAMPILLVGHLDQVKQAIFSPDGEYVVTASKDKTARLWAVETGKQLAVFTGHEGEVRSVDFSHDGQLLVTASTDKTARLWRVKTGEALFKLKGHTSFVNQAKFSPNGEVVITSSWDKTARLWEVKTGQELLILDGHKKAINDVAFTPDGGRVVTVSDDKTARLWDVKTGRSLLVLGGHEKPVIEVVFNANTALQEFVTVSKDKTARLWGMPVFSNAQHLIDFARERLPRQQLTDEQRQRFFLEGVQRINGINGLD